jgi:hypothetical protein
LRPDGGRRPDGGLRPDNRLPTRPGQGGSGERWRPDGDRRPGNRPDWSNRPNWDNRNNIINNRPSWANIDNNRINNINNNWNVGINNRQNNIHNWQNNRPDRMARWGYWGNNVRDGWYNHGFNCFDNNWWDHHHCDWGGWNYWNNWNDYSYGYWYQQPAYSDFSSWWSWPSTPAVWEQPIYYDYGAGGNVTYQDNSVYVNGTEVGTQQEFAQSAAALATVPPPANEEEAAKAEWMPLGTFIMATSEKEKEPSKVIQLAVDKQGIISGTFYNQQTDVTQAVQGQVDKETQRVAFRIGENQNVVVETGLYNLTQDETPVLVHYGADKVEYFLLVRLPEPEGEQQTASTSG